MRSLERSGYSEVRLSVSGPEMGGILVALAGLFFLLALGCSERLLIAAGNECRILHALRWQVLCALMVKWRVNGCW